MAMICESCGRTPEAGEQECAKCQGSLLQIPDKKAEPVKPVVEVGKKPK